MLSIPTFDELEGLVIFRDDADPSRFYYLPKDVHIARDESGKPMFTFLYYQEPIERADEQPGGGYLVFTTELNAPVDLIENRIKPRLKQVLRAENPLSTQIPEPTVAPVDFTEGEVRLIIMQNDQFVRAVQVGRPSFFSDNTASVAVELKADAATLFRDALRQGGSIGAIEYDLTFPVRLPAVTIIGEINSRHVKEAVMGYTEQTVTDESVWGDDSHEERRRTSIAETMESQGLIRLEILKGNVDLSDEDMESLRAFAFQAMDSFIKDHFLQGGSVETAEDRKSQWMEFLSQDIRANFNLNVSYRDVINRQYNPSAQINPSFLGAEVDSLVLDIDLQNAPWYYNTLHVTVDTNFDFDKYGDIVHSVVGHLTYDQRKPDGTRITERESVIFTGDDHAVKEDAFVTRLAEIGRDEYEVVVEVNYKAGPVTQAILDNFATTTRNLTLDVPNPGVIEINFATDPSAFSSNLKAIEIDVEYGDPRNDVPQTVETITLNADAPEHDYRRVIYAPFDRPYRYRWTYVVEDENGNQQRSTNNWVESHAHHVTIPTMFDGALTVNLISSNDWKEVAQLIVDVRYEDADNDYMREASFSFQETTDQRQVWRIPLREPERRTYQYRQSYLMANGAFVQDDWQSSDHPTLVVGNAPGGVVTVEVFVDDVDLGGAVKRVLVGLTYHDVENDVLDTERLLFRDGTSQNWTIALKDKAQDQYTYDVDYIMSDGTRRRLLDQQATIGSSNEFLFVPPPPDAG